MIYRRRSKRFSPVPASKLLKDTSTPIGKYIIYSVVFCSILGIFLNELLSRLINSEELALCITVGALVITLGVLMLKMKWIAGRIERRRMERFNQRLEEKRRLR